MAISRRKAGQKGHVPARKEKQKATRSTFFRRKLNEWWEPHAAKAKGLMLCDRCDAVYYDGYWHTAPGFAAALREKGGVKGEAAERTLCLECRWVVEGHAGIERGYEGKVTLDGLADAEEKAQVLRTVRNFARRATKRDPEDQIVGIEDRGARVVITTSENQMAAGIGKAVDAAFKGGCLEIHWSKDDLPVHVYWKHKSVC